MKKFRTLFIIGTLFTLPIIAAAGGPPGPPMGGPPCWPPPCTVPIDGGILFLAAAGTVYAGKKLLRKNSTINPE